MKKIWSYKFTDHFFAAGYSTHRRFWLIYFIFSCNLPKFMKRTKWNLEKTERHLIYNNTCLFSHSSIVWVLNQSLSNTQSTNLPFAEITAKSKCHISSHLSILNIRKNHFLLSLGLENNLLLAWNILCASVMLLISYISSIICASSFLPTSLYLLFPSSLHELFFVLETSKQKRIVFFLFSFSGISILPSKKLPIQPDFFQVWVMISLCF